MKNVIDANELGNRSRMGTNFMSSFMDTEMAKGKYYLQYLFMTNVVPPVTSGAFRQSLL